MTRYSRQIILPEIGEEGQSKLADASLLIVGVGALGSASALYLTAAGVGHLSIADADEVRLSNLNRQVLYNEGDLGELKAPAAKRHLKQINSDVVIESHGRIDASNLNHILSARKYNAVIDGTDNFETRYLINEACVDSDIPYIYGSVLGWQGQMTIFDAKKGPCYSCLYPERPPAELSPTCSEAGVIGPTPGMIGLLQATEAIKLILECSDLLTGKLCLVDILKGDFRHVDISKDPHCPICAR